MSAVSLGIVILLTGSALFVSSVVDLPHTNEVPVSVTDYLIQNTEYTIPSGSYHAVYAQLNGGTTWNIWASTVEPLDLYVMDQNNFQQWSDRMPSNASLIAHLGLDYSTSWTAPYSATWYFVFEDVPPYVNFMGVNKVVDVTVSTVTTELQQVTVNKPLLSPSFALSSLTALIMFWGIVILAVGILRHERRQEGGAQSDLSGVDLTLRGFKLCILLESCKSQLHQSSSVRKGAFCREQD